MTETNDVIHGYRGSPSTVEYAVHAAYWPFYLLLGVPVWIFMVFMLKAGKYLQYNYSLAAMFADVVRTVIAVPAWLLRFIQEPHRLLLYLRGSRHLTPSDFLPIEHGHSAIRDDKRVSREEGDDVSRSLKNKLWARDDAKCIVCGVDDDGIDETLHADHIVPLSRGGPNELDNLRLLCRTCHECRHARRFD